MSAIAVEVAQAAIGMYKATINGEFSFTTRLKIVFNCHIHIF
jgi:hypothetical protein